VALRVALGQTGVQTGPGVQGDVPVQRWDDLGVLRLLAVADPGVLAATVTDANARRLLEGDPDLLLTARTCLDCAGSAQRTAAALAMHRQTLYARLRRIAELTGCDLDDGRDRLSLHLALVLADIAG
jgi:sugar diacid utilization regulator